MEAQKVTDETNQAMNIYEDVYIKPNGELKNVSSLDQYV